MHVMTLDPLPPFAATALLLDMDGTLLDLAPTPDAVVVPPGLPDTLRVLRERLGGAFGIITGRPVETVDALLGDAPYAVAGEHGGAIRYAPGEALHRPPLPAPPAAWLRAAEAIATSHPGVLLEQKVRGFAVHFRAVPEAGPALHDALAALLAGSQAFELLPAHMLWEVRPRGMDKGKALEALMARAPFAGRTPMFIGDDVTDEDAIRAARALGGAGYQVAPAFGSAGGVRAWLTTTAKEAAEAEDWPPLP
jgi:trehalose 6-phosphate phosphatase